MNKQGPFSKRTLWGLLFVIGIGLVLVLTQSGSRAEIPTADASGTDSLSQAAPEIGSRVTAMTSIGKMIVALMVVIACIYAGIYFLKRLMVKRRTAGKPDGLLEVIETTHLDARKSIALVRVADRAVLIGVTEQHISMLTELDHASAAGALEAAPATQPDAFGAMLKSVAGKVKGLGGRPTTTVAT